MTLSTRPREIRKRLQEISDQLDAEVGLPVKKRGNKKKAKAKAKTKAKKEITDVQQTLFS